MTRAVLRSVLFLTLGLMTIKSASSETLDATFSGIIEYGPYVNSSYTAQFYYNPYIQGGNFTNSSSESSFTDKNNESASLQIYGSQDFIYSSGGGFSANIQNGTLFGTAVDFNIQDASGNSVDQFGFYIPTSASISLAGPLGPITFGISGGPFSGLDGTGHLVSGNASAETFSLSVYNGTAPVKMKGRTSIYNLAVMAGDLYYLDAELANGSEFLAGAGNPNFQSVILPGSNVTYDLVYSYRGKTFSQLVSDESQYFFPSGGVSSFELEGIGNPVAANSFVGFSFDGSGTFSGELISAVPLPSSAPMFGAALIALGAVGYGLKSKVKIAG